MYSSLTGTINTLRMLKASGWGCLFTPDTVRGCNPRMQDVGFYAMDNGAFGAFNGNRPWDEDAFVDMVERFGSVAEFVVVPDVVGDAQATIALTRKWLPWCLDRVRLCLVAVQDGMTAADVSLGGRVGVFVGGSTEWKLATLRQWCALANAAGAWSHVGRVNTVRRINLCASAGASSCDGNKSILFPKNHQRLARAARDACSQVQMFKEVLG